MKSMKNKTSILKESMETVFRGGFTGYKGLAFTVFMLFLVIKYWDEIAEVIMTMLRALVPLVVGIVIAFVVNIMLEFYERCYGRVFSGARAQKAKRGICITLSFMSLVIIALLVMRLVVPQLASCIALLVTDSDGALSKLVDFMQKFPPLRNYADMIQKNLIDAGKLTDVVQNAVNLLQHGSNTWMQDAINVLDGIVSKFTSIFIGLIFSIYLLSGKERLSRQLKRIIRLYFSGIESGLLHVADVLNDSFRSFITGQVKDAFILGVMCSVGLFVLGMPYALMIGVIVAVTAMIPIVGAFLGAAVGATLILSVSPVKALVFIIFFVVIQQIDNNVTYPKIVGNSIGLPGIWILAAVTIGGTAFGIAGMLLFIPIFSTIYKLLQEDMRRRDAAAAKG